MSQEHLPDKGKAPAYAEPDSDVPNTAATQPSSGPRYLVVGNGSTSEHATRLQRMLDTDSGYGGSMKGEEHDTPPPSGSLNGNSTTSDHSAVGVLHQMWYNRQRATLARAINKVLDLLHGLQQMNATWPVHYPSVERANTTSPGPLSSRPDLMHSHSMAGEVASWPYSAEQPPSLRRSVTSIENASAESSQAAAARSNPEPRLISPQIVQDFSILKLDLKLGTLHQAELVHSLEKGSIASLLDGKIRSIKNHLLSLRERIEDTSSKVLVTGDLNAGKSTFCNSLLRRKVLPTDQQPCTAIFCEVLDVRENAGIEEVHAVHQGTAYCRRDESTYDALPLHALEEVVTNNDAYSQCKVYVKDTRTIDESLLNNGVLDIALIDAPGLNADTTKTTAVFARQEEIDVVVFVVSAANHFTQSAKEFIWAAAAEKAYIFIVVNGYDTIRDQDRCQRLILDQVAALSPRTRKEASELVHFVSSNAIPTEPAPPGGPGGDGSGSGTSSGGAGYDPDDDDSDKIRDFKNLEQNLRKFVLEKRARSKLAPARTYLLNILNDVHTLAGVNQDVALSEMERVTTELKKLEPDLESSRRARTEIGEHLDRIIEDTCREVYDYTRTNLASAISRTGKITYSIPYPGFLSALQYAEDLKEAMLSHVADAVTSCEEYSRGRAVQGVNAIKQLGLLHVGNEFQNIHFRPDVMFRRKRDALARQVDISAEIWDFVDWSAVLQRQEKYAGTGIALTIASAVVPRIAGMSSWMEQALMTTRVLSSGTLRQLIVPGIIIAAIAASAYVLRQIPASLHPRLASKISARLTELDYVHTNSSRISYSVRKVLRFPADNLRVGLDQSVKDLGQRRDETLKVKHESELAGRFFRELVDNSEMQRSMVEAVDLDTPPPGLH